MRKILNNKAFSLAEVMLAVLLLTIVTAITAASIPTALRIYHQVVDAANAQTLLSTTATCLREELSTATSINITDDTHIYYTSEDGDLCYISMDTNNDSLSYDGIYLNYIGSSNFSRLLVSNEAASRKLHVEYTKVEYKDGIVTFSNLKVYRDTLELVGVDSYLIRVIGD